MKERFSSEEWESLKILPVAVFVMVAGADGNVDQKEILEFATQIGKGGMLKDELHRELIVDISGNLKEVLQKVGNPQAAKNLVEETKGILKAKLSADEYQRFIGSLIISGVRVANASGGGFLGMGDKISKEEKTVLAAIAIAWDLDPQSISKHFS